MAIFIAICTFLVVVVVLGSLYVLQASAAQQLALKRLDAVMKAEKRGSVSLDLHLIRDELLSDVPLLNKMLLQWDWATRLRQFVAQSGVSIKPGRLLLFSGILAFCADLAVQQLISNTAATIGASVVAAVLPFAFVGFKRARRLRAFEKVFPEAIDLLGRAVRAGHAFTTGLEMIATEMSEPLAGEFRLAFEEQNFGLPLRDALLNLCERVPILDVRFFVTALLVQKETGGNLAEVLDNLSHVIRERFKIMGEVRTKTAQGRLTAAILIALPPAMMILMEGVNPEYVKPLFSDPLGPYILGTAAGLQVIGSLILWKIVRIQI
jgi:tight adherence protein B